MKLELVEDLYVRELNEALVAEKRTLQVMPKFRKAARNEDLRELVDRHKKETEQQISELERLIKQYPPSEAHGTVIDALLADAEAVLKIEAEPDILEAAFIFAAQKIEGHEIACYAGLESMAKLLGHQRDAAILTKILNQEQAMSEGLFGVAEDIGIEALDAEMD